MNYFQFLYSVALASGLFSTLASEAKPISYQNPPDYVQYIEGEDAFEHNWNPGEARHFWWREYADVSGRGILDLAANELPPSGAFTAKYEFQLPDDGYYFIYARMRFPDLWLASPFYWRIDDGSEIRQPQEGMINENVVDQILNGKMALIRLGPFHANKGSHILTIAVRDFVVDALPYISQSIDGFFISPGKPVQYPPKRPVATSPVTFHANVNPQESEFPGVDTSLSLRDWNHYEKLVVPVLVESRSAEAFQGRLRIYKTDGRFVDLPVPLSPNKFGAINDCVFDLSTIFSEDESREVSHVRLFTYDKWYTAAHAFKVSLGVPKLSDRSPDAPEQFIAEPAGLESAPTVSAKPKDFIWNGVSNTGQSREATGKEQITDAYVHYTDGTGAFVDVNLSSAEDVGVAGNSTERFQFEIVNNSDKEIFCVDFGFQGPHEAEDGVFRAGSRAFSVNRLDGTYSLLSPSKLTHDWVCLTSGGRTLYSYLEDDQHRDTRLQFGRGHKGLFWNFSKFVEIKPNETWTSPVIAAGQYEGEEWHLAADKFSEWWFSWAEKPKVSDWFRSIGGMRVGLKYPPNQRESDIESRAVLEMRARERRIDNAEVVVGTQARVGLGWWHSGEWLPLGTEAWYPQGYRLNTEQEIALRQITDEVRNHGGRTSFYTNPLMASRVSSDYEELKDCCVVIAMDGFPVYTEHTFRHHPMALMMADKEWGEKYADILSPVIRKVQPDALYLDQLGAVPAHLNWRNKGSESMVGLWSYHQGKFSEAVLARLYEEKPDLVTGIEGINIYAQQHVTYALLFDGDYEIYKYTFPEYTTMVGRYEELEDAEVIDYAEIALLTGQPLILINDARKLSEATAARVKKIVELKRDLDPILYLYRYRDTVGINNEDALDASRFSGENGNQIIVAVNKSKELKTVSLDSGQYRLVRQWGDDHVSLSSGRLIKVPPESIVAVELKSD